MLITVSFTFYIYNICRTVQEAAAMLWLLKITLGVWSLLQVDLQLSWVSTCVAIHGSIFICMQILHISGLFTENLPMERLGTELK